MIVDGCRGDYLNPALVMPADIPVLTAMAKSGTQYTQAWTGIMESITPACHASIGTGRFAKNNGGILALLGESDYPAIH